jgi:hypothetical protein
MASFCFARTGSARSLGDFGYDRRRQMFDGGWGTRSMPYKMSESDR